MCRIRLSYGSSVDCEKRHKNFPRMKALWNLRMQIPHYIGLKLLRKNLLLYIPTHNRSEQLKRLNSRSNRRWHTTSTKIQRFEHTDTTQVNIERHEHGPLECVVAKKRINNQTLVDFACITAPLTIGVHANLKQICKFDAEMPWISNIPLQFIELSRNIIPRRLENR